MQPADIATRLDRSPVTLLHLGATGLCAFGFLFDLMEIAFGGVLAAVFAVPARGVSPQELSLLLASVYVGAVFGAPAVGWWADRHGRQVALSALLLWLAAMSLAATFAGDVHVLTWVRGAAGLALGAFPPLVMAYLTDVLPPRWRGTLVFVTVGMASLGPVAGIFLVHALGSAQPWGLEAWRWGFVVGGLGALACGLLFLLLPESPRWLLARGRADEAATAFARFARSRVLLGPDAPQASQAGDAAAPEATSLRRRGVLVGGLFLLSPWFTVAFPLLTGALLTQRGYKLSDALLYVGMSQFGPLAGALVSAFVIDRIDRKVTLAACSVAMLGAGAGFVAAQTPFWLVTTSIVFSLAGFLYVSAINLYGAEQFPARLRAGAIAGSWALNRLGAAVAPLLLLPLLARSGPAAMFGVIAATLVASLVLLWFGPAGLQRRPVG